MKDNGDYSLLEVLSFIQSKASGYILEFNIYKDFS